MTSWLSAMALGWSLQPINPKNKIKSMGVKSDLNFIVVGFMNHNSRILDVAKTIFYTN
tara:strand:+ start:19463 stop:19636 length:174 start_codon:yes stop_codon:yes gene_type:complete